MTQQFEDIMDAALEALKSEPATAVLNRYPDQADALAPLLTAAEKVMDWQTAVPTPATPLWHTADRATFLAQVELLGETAVSPSPLLRLKGWLTQKRAVLLNRQVQKERKPMNALLARAAATVAIIFGLGSGTVVLANDSLPDTPLYPVKLMLEETRMAMTDNPAEQANLQLSLAQIRLQEMSQLMQDGDPVDEPLLSRLETHLQTSLQLAAQTGDPEMIGLLTQMQTMLQNEQQTMAQQGDPSQAMYGEINQIMNQYQEQVQAGLDDPPMFRWRHSQDADWEPGENGRQNNQGSNGQNGPGDGTCTGDCEPVGDQNQYGQQDDNTGQNGPGTGDGDGVCANDCDPVGSGPHQGQDGGNPHGQNNGHGNGG